MVGRNCVSAHNGHWWLLAAYSESKNTGYMLRLFHCDTVGGERREHRHSPVCTTNLNGTRPAGRVVTLERGLIRFAQDCHPCYGTAVRAWHITELTESRYDEVEIAAAPVLRGSGAGWNADGMHHMDAHKKAKERWIAYVDGWQRRLRGSGR